MVRLAIFAAMVGVGLVFSASAQQVAINSDAGALARVERLEKMAAEQSQKLAELKTRTDRVTTPCPTEDRVAEVRKVVAELMQDASFREALYPAAVSGGYDPKRGFYMEAADQSFTMGIRGSMQVRYDLAARQTDNPTRQGRQKRDDINAFEVERLFLIFTGQIHSPKVQYQIMVDGGTTGVSSSGLTEDGRWFTYWANVDVMYLKDQYIKAGVFQPPFGGQSMTAGGILQLVDRSMDQYAFGFDRTMGILAHGNLFNNKMTYFAGIVNGILNPNDSPSQNQLDTNFGYYARVAYYLLGQGNSLVESRVGYIESDLAYHKDPEWRMGLSFLFNDNNGDSGTGGPAPLYAAVPDRIRSGRGIGGTEKISDLGTQYFTFAYDTAFKYRGLSIMAEYYLRTIDPESEYSQWELRTASNDSTHQQGGHIQVGYFIVPKKFEVAGRIAGIWDNDGDNSWEYGVGVNYFPWGTYSCRLAADIIRIDEVLGGISSSPNYSLNDELTIFRLILQVGF